MRILPILLLLLSSMLPAAAFGQETEEETPPAPAPLRCSDPQYRQFDFWLGEWSVTSSGAPAGTNVIRAIQGGCALQENWQGAGTGGITGTSYNIYDRDSGQWHQTWVDASGTLLQLDGGLVDGAMVLEGRYRAAVRSCTASPGHPTRTARCASCGKPARTMAKTGT